MLEKKRDAMTFLLGLGAGVLALFILFSVFGIQASSSSKDRYWGKNYEDKTLYFHWKKVELKSAEDFIKKMKIEAVVFIDHSGGFYIADKNGNEFEDWCENRGTLIPEECSTLKKSPKNDVKITHFNELTIFVTEASPGCPFISAGGYSLGLCK